MLLEKQAIILGYCITRWECEERKSNYLVSIKTLSYCVKLINKDKFFSVQSSGRYLFKTATLKTSRVRSPSCVSYACMDNADFLYLPILNPCVLTSYYVALGRFVQSRHCFLYISYKCTDIYISLFCSLNF